jgi:uncharacterized membrane protein YesL
MVKYNGRQLERKGELNVGLFSPNYNKPGPGVDKDTPSKPSFFIFFEVLKRKFWHLLKVNLMTVVFNIPALILAFYVSSVFFQKINLDGGAADFILRFFFAAFITLIPIITIGPVQAGLTFILRNYSREEHSFIWLDFKENFARNFKQGIIITVIDFIVMVLLGIAINVYTSMSGLLPVAAASFIVVTFVIFTIMHLYIYPMLVTVNLSIKDIYKNAFIFSILKLLPNVLMLILNMVITFLAFYYVLIGVILYFLILPCVIGLMNNFYVNPLIKKYVINTSDSEEKEEAFEDDFFRKEIPDEGTGEIDNK